jgi:hypothetical protein
MIDHERKKDCDNLILVKQWVRVLLGLMIGLSVSRLAHAWTSPVNISNTTGRSKDPAFVVDNWGHLHVVWTDDTFGNNEIFYCFFNGQCWSIQVNLSNDSTDSKEPDITTDAHGYPHVAWTDWNTGEILWTFYDGVLWSTPVDLRDYVGFSVSPSLAADDSGRVFISWHDLEGQSDIYFSFYDGISWSEPQNLTDDTESSAFPDMAVDSWGHVHLVWRNYGSDIEIYYLKYDGDLWSTWVNISNLPGYSVDPKIALDSQDHPHVVWEERSGGYHGYYTFHDGSSWQEAIKISDFEPLRIPEIAIDSRDVVHAVWTTAGEVGGEAYWNFYIEGSWSIPVNLSNTPDEASGSPDIGVDPLDNFHVVFVEWDIDNWEIFYTWHSPTGVESQPEEGLLQRFQLDQNFPNPFNPVTVIRYLLAGDEPVHITLRVYNLLGEEIITLIDRDQISGIYEVIWDSRDKNGGNVSSGVYFYRLKVGSFTSTRKMVLLR